MSFIPVAAGMFAGMYGANQQRRAIEQANAQQQQAMQQSLAEQQRQFNIAQQNMAPWMQAGRRALGAQQNLMGLTGDPANQLAALASSPGYQFRLQQGQQNLDSGLAARGGMGSGRAMQAGIDYNQNFASNEYGNRLNQLAGLSGTGQSAAGNMGAMGMNYAQGYGNTLQGGADAYAASRMAGANATQSGILGGANLGLGIFRAMNQPQSWSPNYPNQYQANLPAGEFAPAPSASNPWGMY